MASVESYSIKKLEPLYGYTREVDLRDAGSSIVAFETWLEVGGESGGDDETLERIERYNRDDVVSTWLLRDWLEEPRAELGGRRRASELPRPGPRGPATRREARRAAGRSSRPGGRRTLTAGLPEDAAAWR